MAGIILTYNTPPSRFMAVRKPVYWYFQDQRNPNLIAGESVSVLNVQHPTSGQLVLYPTLRAEDVLVIHGGTIPGLFQPGQMIDLQGVSGGVYDGQHRVLEVLSTSVTKIAAAYVSDESGGTITKYYERHRMIVDATGAGTTTRFNLERMERGSDSVFIMPVHLKAQRELRGTIPDALGYLTTHSAGAVLSCYEPIITNIRMKIGAQYMVPDHFGNIQLGEFIKPPFLAGDDYFIVKASQPFSGLNSELEVGPITYGDNLDKFTISSTVGSDFRLLTYGPIERRILPGEHASITAITDWADEDIRWRVKTYDVNGTLIATSTTPAATYPVGTAIYYPCGPGNLPVIVTGSVAYYDVGIHVPSVGGDFLGNKVVRYHVDRTCKNAAFRIHWRNRAGGEDSFTFTGGYNVSGSTERQTLQKDYIEPEFAQGDDLPDWWSERVWRTNPERKFKVESEHIDMETAHWLGTDLFESAEVYAYIAGFDAPLAINFTTKTIDDVASSTGKRRVVSVEFTIGSDNPAQRI